jgi:FtsH-binding integral membrane protein
MSNHTKNQLLRAVLVATGLIFIFGIGALMRLWPAGFAWTPGQSEYELMFVAVYATLGVFLLLASRAPERHRSLILFAGWSSVVHGLVMAGQALVDASERTHMVGDVPALVLIGAALLVLTPKATPASVDELRP